MIWRDFEVHKACGSLPHANPRGGVMSMQHRLRSAAVLLIAVAAAPCIHAQAPAYPTKPIRMIVPFAPGGNTDIIARVFAPKMGEILGQQIVIENRGGAGSTIGTEVVARSAPDGYVLLMVSAAHTINPAMIRKLNY